MQNFFTPMHRKVIGGILAAFLLVVIMASCSRPAYNPGYAAIPAVQPQYAPQPQVIQQPAPVIVQNGGGHSGGIGDTIIGTAVGSTIGTMVGNHLSRDRQPVAQPSYTPAAPRYTTPTPSYTAPAQRYVAPPRVVQRPSTMGTGTRTSISVGRTSTPSVRR